MQTTLMTGAVAVLAAGLIGGLPAPAVAATGVMPAAQQNALVQKYCAVCHSDAHMNGGLSLEHFDAVSPDSGVAAMMVSKLKSGAIGAAGVAPPDRATVNELIDALSAAAANAGTWSVNRTRHSTTQASILTASVVQAVPSAVHDAEPDMYRLTLTCNVGTHDGDVQLAWAPAPPPPGRAMAVAVDGKALFAYTVKGTEKMGNGASGSSGPGSAIFYTTKTSTAPRVPMPLPAQTLTISDLFPDETVVFPFDRLSLTAREGLSTCFARTRR
jgi:hypothetical protein